MKATSRKNRFRTSTPAAFAITCIFVYYFESYENERRAKKTTLQDKMGALQFQLLSRFLLHSQVSPKCIAIEAITNASFTRSFTLSLSLLSRCGEHEGYY